MTDKTYYAYAVAAECENSAPRKRKAAARPVRGARAVPQEDRHEAVFVLSEAQYEEFEECMAKPNKPNEKMVSVAEEMLAFSRKYR